jgi:hypothetical protein
MFLAAGVAAIFLGFLMIWPEAWKSASYWWLIPGMVYGYAVYYALNRV